MVGQSDGEQASRADGIIPPAAVAAVPACCGSDALLALAAVSLNA